MARRHMSAATEYAELHCHSSYSLLDGASQPEELVAQASALGLRALALTDHDGIYAAPTFCRLAESIGLRPIVGAELTLAPPPPILGGADCGGAGGHSLPGAVPTASLVPGGAGGVPLLGWLNSHPAPPRIGGLGGPIGSVPPALFASHLTLLAEDEQGYRNLCRLISLAREGRP